MSKDTLTSFRKMELDPVVTSFWKQMWNEMKRVHYMTVVCPECGVKDEIRFGEYHKCIICGFVFKIQKDYP